MKWLAKTAPDRPALEVVPESWVEALIEDRNSMRTAQTKRPPLMRAITIYEFLRKLAQLGGHLGRKCDGEPGWIALWRGVEKLLLILRGRPNAENKCG